MSMSPQTDACRSLIVSLVLVNAGLLLCIAPIIGIGAVVFDVWGSAQPVSRFWPDAPVLAGILLGVTVAALGIAGILIVTFAHVVVSLRPHKHTLEWTMGLHLLVFLVFAVGMVTVSGVGWIA